jgi:hypothetical protein
MVELWATHTGLKFTLEKVEYDYTIAVSLILEGCNNDHPCYLSITHFLGFTQFNMFTVKLIKVADVLTKFNLDLSDSSNFHSS